MDFADLNPLKILNEARKNVPALKYAFGALGLLAVLAIVVSIWKLDLRVAVFGPIILIGVMTILLVFAKLSTLSESDFQLPALILLWFTLIVAMGAILLLGSSVFFSWPLDLSHWLVPRDMEGRLVSNEERTQQNASTGSAVTLEGVLSARIWSAASHSSDRFYVGLTGPNEIRLMDRDGALVGNGIEVPGEPALIVTTDTLLFVATEFPATIVTAPRDLSTISAVWDLPHDREILKKHGKSESIDDGLPSRIESFAVTDDTIWVNAADNSVSVIYQIDRETGRWLIPQYYDHEIAFTGRDWALHATSIGVVAFSTETSPSSMYILDEDEIQAFSGHKYDLVSSSTNIWIGKRGAVGVLDSEDQMVEFDVQNESLRPRARLGTLPARHVEGVWDTVQGQWDNDRFWLAMAERPIRESCSLWTKVYRTSAQGVETVVVLSELTLKSFSVTGNTALVIGQNCLGNRAAYIVR